MLDGLLEGDRRTRARALQGLLLAAALLGALALLLVVGEGRRVALAAMALGLAAAAGALQPAVARVGVRDAVEALALTAIAGSLGATALLAAAPAVSLATVLLACWLAAYAALALPPRLAGAEIGLAMVVALAGVVVADLEAIGGGVPGLGPWLAGGAAAGTLAAVASGSRALGRRASELARTDPTTAVANRRFWSLTVEHECARAERTGFPVCVAVIEVDGFRDLAFERGHAAAEQLMREAATAFDDHVRAGDLVGRLSPEQIGVLLPDCGSAAARLVLERLQTAAPPGKTCSAGVAMWDGGESPERLVERAAEALRVAQRAGRSHGMIAAA